MRKSNQTIFTTVNYSITLLTFIALSSCGIYRQNVVNVPLIKQKGQAQISGHIGFTGLDGQASYSLTKNIALLSNYSEVIKKTKENSIFKHNFGEIGLGYYKKKSNVKIRELFLVVGNGTHSSNSFGGDTLTSYTLPYTYINKANYNRFLLQYDFGRTNKKFESAFSPRIFIINYYNVYNTQNLGYLNLPSTYLWSDATLTLRYKPLKQLIISGQISVTIPITGYKAGYYEASPINCSIGLIINLNFFKIENEEKTENIK